MKIPSQKDSAYIIARLCSERFDNAGIKYYLEESPTARDFRNRFAAAFFYACHSVLQLPSSESVQSDWQLAEEFDAAREVLETIKHEFDTWLNIVERWGDAVDGFAWKTQKHRAALAAIEVIEAARDLARVHCAIRHDPYSNYPQPVTP